MDSSKNENSKKNAVIFGIIFALVVVVAVIAVIFVMNTNNQKPAGTVQFNTNPSVTMVVNNSDRVIEVQYLNRDAEVLLSKTNFVGKNVNEAAKLFVQISSEAGYIDATNASTGRKVEIIISNNDNKKVDSLGKKLTNTMNNYFDENGIIAGATYLPLDAIKEKADALGVSTNKYILVKTAVKMHVDYTEDELIKMSEKEILNAIKEKSKELKDVAQEYYESFCGVAKDELAKFETFVNGAVSPILAQIKTLDPDFELNISVDMSFGDLKSQITANISSESIKRSVESALDAIEKNFNDTKAKIQAEIKKLQDKIVADSKEAFESAKVALEGKLATYKKDVEEAKKYYKENKEEIDAKIKEYRGSISVDIEINFVA